MRDGAPGSLMGGEGSAGGGRLCARLGPSPTPAHGPPEGSGRGAPWRRCPKSPTALKRRLQPSPFSPSPGKASERPASAPQSTWSLAAPVLQARDLKVKERGTNETNFLNHVFTNALFRRAGS